MNAKEMRGKAAKELNEELLKLRREQFSLRMQRATGQTVKPNDFGRVRKDIARLKTVLAEQAIPVEEVTPDTLHAEAEIAQAEFDKATTDEGRRAATERLAQIMELRTGLFG